MDLSGDNDMFRNAFRRLIYLIAKRRGIIRNQFKSKYTKKALISYITYPFYKGVSRYHSNTNEVLRVADIFHEIGFQVDVVDWDKNVNLCFDDYDVLFGFGQTYDESFYASVKDDLKRIYYATGAHVTFQNKAELDRCQYLFERKGVMLKPRRLVRCCWSASTAMSNLIVTLGNDFTANTYRKNSSVQVKSIPISVFCYANVNNNNRSIAKAKREFLWFGSNGLVHKGLDLTIEAFSNNADLVLHICAPKDDEFFDLYKNEFEMSNVVYHGYLDVASKEFNDVIQKCMFTIFPSCSEGGGGALLTTMGAGLIPIATIESSVNLKEIGFIIEEATVECIDKLIREVSKESDERLCLLSDLNYDFVRTNHTIDEFKSCLEDVIKEVVDS